jgi:hypothetical protein
MLMHCATVLPFLLLYVTKSEYLILSKSTLKILIISLRYGVSPSSSPWSDPVRPISVDGLHRALHQHGLYPVSWVIHLLPRKFVVRNFRPWVALCILVIHINFGYVGDWPIGP